jgi:membrane protease YdiL (CAAX protease family)
VPAIVEETFFRGTMQQLFISWFRNPWAGIIVTSILFSAIHMSYYGFLTRAMLGVVLGLLYYYGKSIWLNILAHFLNNAVAITLLYVYSLKGKVSKDALEDHYPLWIGLMATIILIFLLIIFKKKSEDFLTKDEQLLLQNNVG